MSPAAVVQCAACGWQLIEADDITGYGLRVGGAVAAGEREVRCTCGAMAPVLEVAAIRRKK
jgi:hypothetical protein